MLGDGFSPLLGFLGLGHGCRFPPRTRGCCGSGTLHGKSSSLRQEGDRPRLEARGGERKLAGLPVVCCCCWCCCCRCCAGRCCAGCSAGAGSSAAAAAGCCCCCWRWVVCCGCCCCSFVVCCSCLVVDCRCLVCCSCLVVPLTARRGESNRGGGVGGGVHKIDLINYLRFLRCVHPVT